MTEMNSIEERDNLIELLKQALKFYANIENYKGNRSASMCCSGTSASLVEMDEGAQARYAIETANQLAEINQKMEDDYDKTINELLDTDVDDMDIRNLIKTFKQIEEQ